MKFLDQVSRFVAEETRGEPASRGDNMVAKMKPSGKNIESLYDRKHVTPRRPFAEELARMIDNPPLGSVVMEITPDMAKEMLRYNEPNEDYRNRPFYPSTAEKYAKRMEAGEWHLTGEPIQFSDCKRLIDGQHRLHGVVRSGVTLTAHVIFGVPHPAFAYIDIGRKRTAGDIFAINGVPNARAVASAISFVAGYDRGTSLVKGTSGGGKAGIQMSEAELHRFYLDNTGIQDGMRFCSRCGKNKLAAPALILALWYICARKSRRAADEFFEILTTGAGATSRNDPALVLRNKLYEMKVAQGTLGVKLTAVLVLSAWNLYRSNRSARGWRISMDERVPRAI